ncbi:hypothetical protein [Eupransor demetentiae]|uniref:Uncharacterized protein n=1 Tax=Eupransor demetentiae TaxID=3109584 RepID=A0ABM9N5E5_9LACO|nr:hypothetical protein R54876_GBNLAHCA_00970 [Lactobacillaceae bacterium LMG 33000]
MHNKENDPVVDFLIWITVIIFVGSLVQKFLLEPWLNSLNLADWLYFTLIAIYAIIAGLLGGLLTRKVPITGRKKK